MSPDIRRAARKRQYQLARDAAEQFEAAPIHNRVHEQVDGQHESPSDLARLLDLTEGAYELADDRDDLDNGMQIFGAAEDLNDAIDDVVDEEIARACGEVLQNGHDWTNVHDEADIKQAREEAREWLLDHEDAAERVGIEGPEVEA